MVLLLGVPPYIGGRRMEVLGLIGLLLHLSAVCADSHSLRYYKTVVSAPGSGLPEFSAVGYVDDREIVNYNSDTGRTRPKVPWIEKVEPEYWERNTQIEKGTEETFKYNVKILMSQFNQSGGVHIVQWMFGCERGDDGRITVYEQYGNDGREFLALDTRTWTFVPTMARAQISTQKWNSPDVQVGQRNKDYREQECIEWLQKRVENGRADLERREPEKSSVWVIAVVVAVAAVALLLAIGGFLLYRRRIPGYRATGTSDASTELSNNPARA